MKTLLDITENDLISVVLVEDIMIDCLLEEKQSKEIAKRHGSFDHAEDMLVRNGGENFHNALSALSATHDHLAGGRKSPNFSLSTKFDGSPAVVFGHDPKNGKFFVGTKSFFNKTPKVNYSDKDIEANHGHQPALSNRLSLLLKHLKKTTPSKGIFQGDLMYAGHDVAEHEGNLSFTPNTITYNVDKGSHDGKKILKSKAGIAPHTEYMKQPDGSFVAKHGIDLSQFNKTDDIHLFDTKVKGPFKYDTKDKKKFAEHINKARELHSKLDPELFKNHEKLLLAYINSSVKTKKDNSVEGYLSFLNRQFSKRADNVKLDKTKDSIRSELNKEMQNITQNKAAFNTLFQAHKHVQSAKNILVKTLSQGSPYKESILGAPSKPEGYVVSHNGQPIKMVDRHHFSAANFDWNEKANPDDNPVVLHWGRMSPAHKGHEKMINKGADIARRTGAKQKIVATRKSGDKDNPLTPQDKLKWIKTLFPGQDVALAGKEAHTIIAQLQQLHHKGTKDVTIVAGQDRVADYTRILAKYNGHGKLFNFNRARVVSSGERDPDNEGTEGVSATKVRKAAQSNDYSQFRKSMPTSLKDKHAKALFSVLKGALKKVKK